MNQGFLQLIIILVILLIILSLMGVSLLEVFNDKIVKDNFAFVWKFMNWLWDNYLKSPMKIAWRLWVEILWKPFVENMERIRQGRSPKLGGESL